jgi:hypothetical protein
VRYWLIFSEKEQLMIAGKMGVRCDFSDLRINEDTFLLEPGKQSIYIKLVSADSSGSSQPLPSSDSKVIDVDLPEGSAFPSAKQFIGQWLQLEAFLNDLTTLEKALSHMRIGNNPLSLGKSISSLSGVKGTLAEIKSRVGTYSGPMSSQVDPKILSIGKLVGSIDSAIERKYWEIQSRALRVNFIFALAGIVIGFALSLLGRLII